MTREEAIKHLSNKVAFCNGIGKKWTDGVNVEALEMAIEALQELEQKKGKWLKPTGLSNPICSECHSCPNLLFGLTSKFCPNCGAKMNNEKTHNFILNKEEDDV